MKETKKNGAAQSKAGKRDYSAFKNMYRKIPQDLRDVIVYYIGDRPLVIHEGVNEVTGEVVTAEFIRQWHMDRDREVYNNNKHLKPPADEHKKTLSARAAREVAGHDGGIRPEPCCAAAQQPAGHRKAGRIRLCPPAGLAGRTRALPRARANTDIKLKIAFAPAQPRLRGGKCIFSSLSVSA